METCIFSSSLAPHLQSFLELRETMGRRRQSDRKLLIYLDRFLMEKLKPGQTITREIAACYVDSMAHLSTGTRINRICILRQFCRYLQYFDSRTCVIHRQFLPLRTRPAPYIYSEQDLRAIMAAARHMGPTGSLRPSVMATLVGLLAATGLRIGEALKLTLADVDLKRRVLVIRETKFNKSRYVPFSPSTARHLTEFLRERKKAGFSIEPGAAVFVNPSGHAYGHPRICAIFIELLRSIGLRGPVGQPGPRVHDLRHGFAVRRLLAWYREGADLSAKLPVLSTYLGHTTVTGTEVYLRATAELLEQADKRFHNHCALPPSIKEYHHAYDH